MKVIKAETIELKNKYADPRRTEIRPSAEEFNPEDFYADEDMVITISHLGYIKRTFDRVSHPGPGRSGDEGKRDEG